MSIKITKEQFLAYEGVRLSGATNMFNVSNVIMLLGDYLTREDCLDIMKNYDKYSKKYLKSK